MGLELFITPRAEKDLRDIWTYTLAVWGERQAVKYDADLWDASQRIRKQPRSGKSLKNLPNIILASRVNRHIVFYSLTKDKVIVARILHERMDFTRHLH